MARQAVQLDPGRRGYLHALGAIARISVNTRAAVSALTLLLAQARCVCVQ